MLDNSTTSSPASSSPATFSARRFGSAEAAKTRRVFHLINGEHFSGAERVQDLLSLALPEFGYNVEFGLIKPDRFLSARQAQHVPAHQFAMKHRFDLSVAKRCAKLVADNSFDLIHAHTPRTLMIAAEVAKRTRAPLVYHVHSPVSKDSKRWLQNWLNAKVEKRSLRSAAMKICVSENIREYMLEQGHAEETLTMVPNGVQVVDPVPERRVPLEPWTIGTVALFRPRKGIEVLLKALSILKHTMFNGGAASQQKCPMRLLAVGPFESEAYQQQILQLVDKYDVADLIEWTGFTRDVNPYFQSMDLFVLPSLFGEGLPMVILEAMANGVPIIASDVEGIRQAVRHTMDGYVCRPGDAQQLAETLYRLFNEGRTKWQSLSQSALQRQRSSFSERSMAQGVAAVYDRLLGK